MSSLKLNSSGGGSVTLTPASTASNLTATVPAVADTLAVQGQLGLRNKIINGAMMIDQRNAGASVTPVDGGYTLDRWVYLADQASKCTIQQNAASVTPPAGFSNYLGVTSTAATTITTSQQFSVVQRVEGFNMADLAWGTASAASVTLSFWVRSSLTGTFGGALRNDAGNYNYVFSYTISSANTWEQKTVTITGATSGTWTISNGRCLQVAFSLGAGATLSTTAGSWTTSNYWNVTSGVQVLATNGATFYITGVQLEKGATATPFENRLYGTELALCQRYLPKWNANASYFGSGVTGVSGVNTKSRYLLPFVVAPRTYPTGITNTTASNFAYIYSGGSLSVSAVAYISASDAGAIVELTHSAGTLGQATFIYGGASDYIYATGCEL